MQLENKNAIVYGAAGSMGSAVARALASEGATVFLAGHTEEPLQELATEIRGNGGQAFEAVVDAMDQESVETHARGVFDAAGHIDISFNAVNYPVFQNVALIDMPLEEYLAPIEPSARTHFITATTAARHMKAQGSGVIINLSATSSLEWRHEMGGFGVANAGIETLTRALAGEIGPFGVRVVGLCCNFTPETYPEITPEDYKLNVAHAVLGRLPLLKEVAGTVVYLASDAAGAMTGTTVNLSCGAVFS